MAAVKMTGKTSGAVGRIQMDFCTNFEVFLPVASPYWRDCPLDKSRDKLIYSVQSAHIHNEPPRACNRIFISFDYIWEISNLFVKKEELNSNIWLFESHSNETEWNLHVKNNPHTLKRHKIHDRPLIKRCLLRKGTSNSLLDSKSRNFEPFARVWCEFHPNKPDMCRIVRQQLKRRTECLVDSTRWVRWLAIVDFYRAPIDVPIPSANVRSAPLIV